MHVEIENFWWPGFFLKILKSSMNKNPGHFATFWSNVLEGFLENEQWLGSPTTGIEGSEFCCAVNSTPELGRCVRSADVAARTTREPVL